MSEAATTFDAPSAPSPAAPANAAPTTQATPNPSDLTLTGSATSPERVAARQRAQDIWRGTAPGQAPAAPAEPAATETAPETPVDAAEAASAEPNSADQPAEPEAAAAAPAPEAPPKPKRVNPFRATKDERKRFEQERSRLEQERAQLAARTAEVERLNRDLAARSTRPPNVLAAIEAVAKDFGITPQEVFKRGALVAAEGPTAEMADATALETRELKRELAELKQQLATNARKQEQQRVAQEFSNGIDRIAAIAAFGLSPDASDALKQDAQNYPAIAEETDARVREDMGTLIHNELQLNPRFRVGPAELEQIAIVLNDRYAKEEAEKARKRAAKAAPAPKTPAPIAPKVSGVAPPAPLPASNGNSIKPSSPGAIGSPGARDIAATARASASTPQLTLTQRREAAMREWRRDPDLA